MRLSTVQMNGDSKIDVLNLISNDATRLELSVFFAPFLIIAPIQAITIIVILVVKVDLAILSGIGLMACITALQTSLTRLYNHYKVKAVQITDHRINLTTEILNGIRILKLYGWEKAFENLIKQIRA